MNKVSNFDLIKKTLEIQQAHIEAIVSLKNMPDEEVIRDTLRKLHHELGQIQKPLVEIENGQKKLNKLQEMKIEFSKTFSSIRSNKDFVQTELKYIAQRVTPEQIHLNKDSAMMINKYLEEIENANKKILALLISNV